MRYEDVYQKYYMVVYTYLMRRNHYQKYEAEELTQEVFCLAYVNWEEVREHPNIPGYLVKAAAFKGKKEGARKRWMPVEHMEVLESVGQDVREDEALNRIELYLYLEKIISREELQWLLDYYIYGYTAAEIAKGLGITESCFKVRIARLKEKIRKKMKEDGLKL